MKRPGIQTQKWKQIDMSNRNQRRALQASGGSRRSAEPGPEEISRLVDLFNRGNVADAEAIARKMTERFPKFGFGWKCLGVIIKTQGNCPDSLEPLRKAAALMPNDAEAQSNLGVVYKDLQRPEEAEACYLRAIRINPDLAEAYNNLGVVYMELGRRAEAEANYRRSLAIKPDCADVYSNLGAVLNDLGHLEEAAACHRQAVLISPDFAKAHFNLGNTLSALGNVAEAEACYRRAVAINPGYAEAYCNLGAVLKDLGRFQDAETCCRRALLIKPDFAKAWSVLLFTLNYAAEHQPHYLRDEADKYGQIVARDDKERFSAWRCLPRPVRLRVGLVSGDLCSHPVGYFLESILSRIDATRLEFFVYATDNGADEVTERIRPYCSTWKLLCGLSDKAAARLIQSDGVHLLLDLSGHTANNRLPVFAWKPAPVQVSWLGYFATTGVKEIDFLLADQTGVPHAHQRHFTEQIWYLPDTRLCFTPPDIECSVSELPALKTGQVTFGSFQNLAKIGDRVLALWREILDGVPGARLRLQCRQLGDPEIVAQFTVRLQQNGIESARVVLFGPVSRTEYLSAHADVDLILDTMPYPGGTTTCESLWMGVPTVTCACNSMLSRQGASLLTAAGLSDWVTASETEYVAQAISLARDLPKLAALRSCLRQQVLESPLFDAPRFAGHLTDALWGMWEQRQGADEVCIDGVPE
jgi:predicted O-linked N-acetylglucosamine transferase (SPINDLY family)